MWEVLGDHVLECKPEKRSPSGNKWTVNDLVITLNYMFYRISNRWKFTDDNEPVDYETITNWSDELAKMSYPILERMKICCLPRLSTMRFLVHLATNAPLLQHLEIGHIEQIKSGDLSLPFESLRTLSIQTVKRLENDKITFIAPRLSMVCLGKFCFYSSVLFISFIHQLYSLVLFISSMIKLLSTNEPH